MRLIIIEFKDAAEEEVLQARDFIVEALRDASTPEYRIIVGAESDPLDDFSDDSKVGSKQRWFFGKMFTELSAMYYKTQHLIPDHPALERAQTVLSVADTEQAAMDKARCSQLIDAMKEAIGELRQ